MYCPQLSDPKIKEEFTRLESALGNNIAGLVYHKNNGNFLDKTPSGEDSLMFQQLVRMSDSIESAIKLKSQYYSENYLKKNNWLKTGIEPIEELDNMISDAKILQRYNQANLNLEFALERLPSGVSAYVKYIEPPKVKRAPVKNKHVKSAVVNPKGQKSVYKDEIDGPRKRYVVDMYFRLNRGDEVMNPFSLGNPSDNIEYVHTINSEFKDGVRAVQYNPEKDVIEFADEIEMTQFKLSEDSSDSVQALGQPITKLDPDKEIISRYQGLISVINKRLSGKTGRRDSLLARRDRLEEKIKELQINGSNKIIIEQAEADISIITSRLGDIEANLLKNLNEDQLWMVMADLDELSAYIRGWNGLAEMLDAWNIPLKEVRDKLTSITGELDTLHKKQLSLTKDALLEYANNKVAYKKFIFEDLYGALEDEGAISRQVLGASMSNSDLVQVVDDLIRQAARSINDEILDKDQELNSWLKKLKKHLNIKDENKISEMFYQLDKDGKWTGAIVGKVKQEYFDIIRELHEKGKKSGKQSDYFRFRRENTHELLESEYNAYMALKTAGNAFDIKKVSNRKFANGEYIFVEKDFVRQEELIAKYNAHREAYKKDVLAGASFTNPDGTFISEDLENNYLSIIDEWTRKNDPWYKATSNDRNFFATYRIRDKVDSKWFDKKFEKIQKDPVLKEFYEFYRGRMLDNDDSLPFNKKDQSNLVYSVAKTSMEELKSSLGVSKTLGLIGDEAWGLFSAESESDIEGRAIVGDKVYRNIPVGMLYVNLTPDKRTPSIFKALKAHTDVAVNFKYKTTVEPIASAAQDIINTMSAVKKVSTETGETYTKNTNTGNIHEQKGALIETTGRLKYLVGSFLYGESKDAPDVHGKGKKDRHGDTKKFSVAKTVDSLNKFTYLKGLALPNFISPTVNLIIGLTNNFTYSAGGIDFSDSSLAKAYGLVFKASSKHLGQAAHSDSFNQVMTWMIRLNLLPDINSAAIEDSQSWDKILTIFQSKGEYINQGASAMAYLMHNTVKDKNGKDVSILDAFKAVDGKLIWDVDKMGEQSTAGAGEIISADGKGVNLFRLGEKLKGINEYLHGDYFSPLELKKTAWGRAAALFKTWLFMTTIHRFGGTHFDRRLQREVKGRYRSIFAANTKDGIPITIGKILPILLKGIVSKSAFDTLSDVDKVNLKRDLRELQILFAITVVGMLLMSMDDDDDDVVRKKAMNLLVNLATKTQNDLEFYINPASMYSILNNIVPIVGTLNDIKKITDAFYDTIIGDPTYKNGTMKDQYRIPVAIGKALPISSGLIKMHNYREQQYNFGAR